MMVSESATVSGFILSGNHRSPIYAITYDAVYNYFSTLGIPFVEGRDFTQDDRDLATPIAIINDTMAAKYWPKHDELGKGMQLPIRKEFADRRRCEDRQLSNSWR